MLLLLDCKILKMSSEVMKGGMKKKYNKGCGQGYSLNCKSNELKYDIIPVFKGKSSSVCRKFLNVSMNSLTITISPKCFPLNGVGMITFFNLGRLQSPVSSFSRRFYVKMKIYLRFFFLFNSNDTYK